MSLSLAYSLADQNFEQTKSLGIFNISLQLLETIAPESDLNLTVFSNPSLEGRFQLPKTTRVLNQNLPLKGRFGRILWDQWAVYSAAREAAVEWLFLPKGFASFVRKCPVRLCAWVADGMQDYYQRNYPEAVSRAENLYFRRCLRATLQQAEVIFTLSDFTSSEVARIAREMNVQAPIIKTLGVGFRPELAQMPKTQRIVVLAGRYPHKRTDLALSYVAAWQEESKFGGAIDWVGSLPPGMALPTFKGWKLWERLPEKEYRNLLRSARVLVYFSEYEGFGMPPVEAALAGACPVFSGIPVTREVMGEAGFSFLNGSQASFHKALNSALQVSPAQITQWSAELLEKHSWAKVAGRFMNTLRQLRIEKPSPTLLK